MNMIICLDMNKIKLSLFTITILSTIILQGCMDQNNDDSEGDLVTENLDKLVFKSNQLPYYVTKQNEEYSKTDIPVPLKGKTFIFQEFYRTEYVSNESKIFITLEMKKLNSTDVAKDLFEAEKNDFDDQNYDILSINEIGDESITFDYRDSYIILFRKSNIIVTLFPMKLVDFSLEDYVEYAKIIVDNIESSM
jgi:hypothetical protein